jgi:pimeloyl-ACP methyl ester carboxylesterase
VPNRWFLPFAAILLCALFLRADGPADNVAEKVRPVPPPGVTIPDSDHADLQGGVNVLGKEIESLRDALKDKPVLLALLPDVEIYWNAVRYALTYDEFYDLKEVTVARALLSKGTERARLLREGKAPWATATGLVVRGYRSKIDGSVQPYGLVVPESYRSDTPHRFRLDLWCHGRGEKLTELNFLKDRERSRGEFTPPNAFVLHLYGRYCNANKFAGEIDCLEALASVKARYPIDDDRLVMRGFSMGGAACWQFAVHYPTLWCAAAPGAGFSETADFLKVFQKEEVQPAWYEQKLYHLYDCTDYALNLFNCPTVAYSGENDSQKQAADRMSAAMSREGMSLMHLIGPKTGHSYHRATKELLNERIDAIAARGRAPLPSHIRFITYTLRYNTAAWITVDGLGRHWERAIVDAAIPNPRMVAVGTNNVTAFTISMPPGLCPLENNPGSPDGPEIVLNGERLPDRPRVRSDRSWQVHLRRGFNRWWVDGAPEPGLAKIPGLQGPIDDAFFDSFLMVKPTGTPLNAAVGSWAEKELAHAVDHWRKQFRGEARVKADGDVTDADIAEHNLVLWGDPSSNKVLARIADKLPIHWSAEGIKLGEQFYAADSHVPVLIYPNPLNPRRYVVLNSGFTFREYDYLNNARQVPKLPDYAVIDIRTVPSSRWPGKVVTAGFFDERWRLPGKANEGEAKPPPAGRP